MAKKPLSRDRLCELLEYDPETGLFRWLESRGRVSAGHIAGSLKNDSGYIFIRVDEEMYRAHRLVWLYVHGRFPPEDMDHINGDRADNRLSNLREATRSQNLANSKKRVTAMGIYKGAHFDKRRNKWSSRFAENGKLRFLGYFETPEEANARYMVEARRVFGEFARAA